MLAVVSQFCSFTGAIECYRMLQELAILSQLRLLQVRYSCYRVGAIAGQDTIGVTSIEECAIAPQTQKYSF